METNTATTTHYAIYSYDPETGDHYDGPSAQIAFDLVAEDENGNFADQLHSESGFATVAAARTAAEAHAGTDLDWTGLDDNGHEYLIGR